MMPVPSRPIHKLQEKVRPSFEQGDAALRLVDLFCGCGGLSLGVAQSATKHAFGIEFALAVDSDQEALDVYLANFPKATVSNERIENLFDGEADQGTTVVESALSQRIGEVDIVVGGPPCQGHSDLNNYTRRDDPRNNLYMRMTRAAKVLNPQVVLIENVPSVRHSTYGVIDKSILGLRELGYEVAESVILLSNLGVPQTRRRHVLFASRISGVRPKEVLREILDLKEDAKSVRWAIGDLVDIASNTKMDEHPKASDTNLARMKKMLRYGWYDLPNKDRPPCHQNEDHSYRSMYGRLDWSKPAQTITSGFTSIGQGRYMHPEQPRALTMHEAARLQGFPDYFDFSSVWRRTSLATMIGNAVPPELAASIFNIVIPKLRTPS